ncbi:RNA polymerase sigma factor [Nocardioides sp. AE5]|uniref:RNA polymerase sigma factor n=1 Tax=Nocardioides sp. AE5 TaxID=2962573 RepID=UPI0028819932|nr:RNA polymerase sigma factor [Nocardioides sp. AE5]MDT0202753.1 RNA polymerase sigma factor [Nocardioides sp. AE5]
MTTDQVHLDLAHFVEHDYPGVVAAVAAITRNAQQAPDAVQDALVGYLSRPPAREVQNLAAWITVVASNRTRDHHRRRDTEARALSRLAPTQPVVTVTDPANSLHVDLHDALARLPLRQRQVCVLHYLLDQSVETIAEGLQVSSGTVKTQLHRARKSLARMLKEEPADA